MLDNAEIFIPIINIYLLEHIYANVTIEKAFEPTISAFTK